MIRETLPPKTDDFLETSDRVLAWAGDRWHVAYVQYYPQDLVDLGKRTGDEFLPKWKLDGRDGYDLDGVTHWQELPPPPAAPGD